MLDSLHVKDLALIKETEIEFRPGLNILTGETGAGKSIIIGSVLLALGQKASKSMIRSGASSGLSELIFTIDDDRIRDKCQELGIDTEGDTLVISRKITENKSISRINGETVSLKTLKELSAVLLDVCGQHEHQTLTDTAVQAGILDDYCDKELASLKDELALEYRQYRKLLTEMEDARKDSGARGREMDLAAFEVNEIEAAALKEGEDTELEEQYSKMVHSQRITGALEAAHSYLTEKAGNAGESVGYALRELKSIGDMDKSLSDTIDILSVMEEQIFDVAKEIGDRCRDAQCDPGLLSETEERLNVINRLKDRYGGSISAILEYKSEREALIEKYSDFDAYMEGLSKRCNEAEEKVRSLCARISDIRKAGAKELEKLMIEALSDLSFAQVEFSICVEADEEHMGPSGYDDIRWLISVNPGQDMKPLSEIASGGELSRIMLALKTVMAGGKDSQSLIFDEIDAGISGKTAWQVSKKLARLSREHQVICITHLPQIAAMADHHYLIEKGEEDGDFGTRISDLSRDGSISELARLLGSDTAMEAAMTNARELKSRADTEKNS